MINCPSILAGMSHEVRTHMNAIVAFSFLLSRKECNDPEKEEYGSQILASCEQLIGLFDNFLDSALIDTGLHQPNMRIIKLSSIIDDLTDEFRETVRKESDRDIVLVSEKSKDGSVDIIIDTDRLFRLIRILFQNALHNTKSGYIKIGYYLKGEVLTFYVLDSGQGYFKCKEFLQTEDLNQSLLSDNDTSSAINLTLAKKLIHILGGSAWIECNGLTGTGFYFSVPVTIADTSDIKIENYSSSLIAI